MPLTHESLRVLVCPQTKLPLTLCTAAEAETRMHAHLVPRKESLNASGKISKPFGVTPWVLLREDLQSAYPVVDGHPILLLPEMLVGEGRQVNVDLRDPKYAEAYQEMEFYNEVALQEAQHITESEAYEIIKPALSASPTQKTLFPDPKKIWIDAVCDCITQWDAYKHLAPLEGKRVLQLGGKGGHAVKFLLAGAAEAWVVTPMLGEVQCARMLGEAAEVADRLHCVVAIAEELPLASETIDAIYCGGCLHHMQTAIALPEAARVLRNGGKFTAAEPWRALFYGVGTKLLGKREPNAYCRPLTKARIAPFSETFKIADILRHGAIVRYPILALNKFGISIGISVTWRLYKMDDAISAVVPGWLHRIMASAIVLRGTK